LLYVATIVSALFSSPFQAAKELRVLCASCSMSFFDYASAITFQQLSSEGKGKGEGKPRQEKVTSS
jgi:hypothetical protein